MLQTDPAEGEDEDEGKHNPMLNRKIADKTISKWYKITIPCRLVSMELQLLLEVRRTPLALTSAADPHAGRAVISVPVTIQLQNLNKLLGFYCFLINFKGNRQQQQQQRNVNNSKENVKVHTLYGDGKIALLANDN